MNSLKLISLLLLATLMATITIPDLIDAATLSEEERLNVEEEELTTSLRVAGRFLASNGKSPRLQTKTCDKYPTVCRAKGSPGPYCCKKKCVNVMTDELNCGMCGKKCKFSETCCKGQCVNTMFNTKHCGGCNKKCKKGKTCTYGMCNYS
ncbi:stigma-specific STIG1-like protein 3 [Mangifera indica]|uniref:stigma-specific STIG1-like protein 3 n=1 Tax=Mangifera indica TaxID=29780 RepID=UPI001CFA04FF|nr:stigma-specific STIG1-like protein 3 [Mangifera indica]